MSTNYYHRSKPCSTCGHYDEQHIGKRSGGWEFSFAGYVDSEGKWLIDSWAKWLERLRSWGRIFDEYGKEIPVEEFYALVEETKGQKSHYDYVLANYPERYDNFTSENWKDSEGWSFLLGEFS